MPKPNRIQPINPQYTKYVGIYCDLIKHLEPLEEARDEAQAAFERAGKTPLFTEDTLSNLDPGLRSTLMSIGSGDKMCAEATRIRSLDRIIRDIKQLINIFKTISVIERDTNTSELIKAEAKKRDSFGNYLDYLSANPELKSFVVF